MLWILRASVSKEINVLLFEMLVKFSLQFFLSLHEN
jgi:hypothetical protein